MDQLNDDKKPAVEKEVETETTQTESPTVEEPTTEVQTEVPTEPDTHQQTEEESRAFQAKRLNEENRRLKEELEQRKTTESAFNVFKPKPNLGQVAIENYTDPTTGQVNWAGYNNAVTQQATSQARVAAQDEIDEFRAREKHPDLFADSDTEKEIADLWFAAKMRGENPTVVQIADKYAKRFSKILTKAEKAGAEKILTEVSSKEQATMAASSQTSAPARQAQSEEELERLRQQSRGKGRASEEAVALRMKNIPWSK
jgi:hypothetical protein